MGQNDLKAFFRDIFGYHHHFNQELAHQLEQHEEGLQERTVPLFCHVINAHQVWNARILGKSPVGVHDVRPLEECRSMDEANHAHSLHVLETVALDREVPYQNSKGKEFRNSVRDILFHVANHSSHHKGQIVSDLRASGLEPLVTDFVFYKR